MFLFNNLSFNNIIASKNKNVSLSCNNYDFASKATKNKELYISQ